MIQTPDLRNTALEKLSSIFPDQINLKKVSRLEDFESVELIKALKYGAHGLTINSIRCFVTGRTGAGKTTLGNLLLHNAPMKVTGRENCTHEVAHFKTPSNFEYFDLPGNGSDAYDSDGNIHQFENINRAALSIQQKEDLLLGIEMITEFPCSDHTHLSQDSQQPTTTQYPVESWQRALKYKPEAQYAF